MRDSVVSWLQRPQIVYSSIGLVGCALLWTSYRTTLKRKRTQVWMDLVGSTFESMLTLSEYPEDIRDKCMDAFRSCMVPLMGPTPAEFKTLFDHQPCSTMVDDHTPVELSSVVAASGKAAIRFYVEPLCPISGIPAPQSTWLSSVYHLGSALDTKHQDLTWLRVCLQTLTLDLATVPNYYPQSAPMGLTQFAFGAEVDYRGNAQMKAYFCPGARSEVTGIPAMTLLAECASHLDLTDSWSQLSTFIATRPSHHNVTPLFIAAGAVPSHLNSAKVYFRTQANTLGDLIQYMTMGGRLPIEHDDIRNAVASFRRLWKLLFGEEVEDDTALQSLHPLHPTSGFLVYYDIGRDLPFPRPKVCINVKHFCKNDEVIARAIAQYYHEVGCPDVGAAYEAKLRAMYSHRSLRSRSGIHTYIGVGVKGSGSRVTVYHSPEAFAPEREIGMGSVHSVDDLFV